MKKKLAIVADIFIIAAGVCAQIQPVVSSDEGEGRVDWSERVIMATGIGAPNPHLPKSAQRPAAQRAARNNALRNALEAVKGIAINSSTTVKNFMTTNDVITSEVNGYIQGFRQKGSKKELNDGSMEITMEIPVDGIGSVGEKLIAEGLAENPRVEKFEGKKSKNKHIFTGLIVDCKGLDVKPALSPRVLDRKGREVYGSAYVTKKWAVKYGMAGYAKKVSEAAELDRVGKNPGKIKAVEASGENKTDVVISNEDAADIRSAAQNLKFLSECRVVFVID